MFQTTLWYLIICLAGLFIERPLVLFSAKIENKSIKRNSSQQIKQILRIIFLGTFTFQYIDNNNNKDRLLVDYQ